MGHLIKMPGFALKGVEIRHGAADREVFGVGLSDDGIVVNETEYLQNVPGVGRFYASDGRYVEYMAEEGADPEWVHLYLNGQVLVALLHQRRIISFHASSFVHNGLGVMVLGETGAGKSSLTLAFSLQGGGFLADDLTPVVFDGPASCIMPLNRKVKIRHHTAGELGIGTESLTEAERGTGKKYLSLAPVQMSPFPLGLIVKIETGPVKEPSFHIPSPAERFALLRSEVCSWEMLAGMPETEKAYLQQLVRIVEQTDFISAVRPPEIRLKEFYSAARRKIEAHIGKKEQKGSIRGQTL